MSRNDKTSARSDAGVSFSRGDSGVWDDAKLIELWNAELELIQQGRSGTSNRDMALNGDEDNVEFSDGNSSDATDDDEEESESATSSSSPREGLGCGRAFAALANAKSSDGASPQGTAGVVAAQESSPLAGVCPLPVGHLPEEVRALAQSFYTAGYEAGRYSALHESRKRNRS